MKACSTCKYEKWETCYFRELDEKGDQVTGKEQVTYDYPCSDCSHRNSVRDMWEQKDTKSKELG